MGKLLSTSDLRRDTVIDSAIRVFARTGYLGTPIAAVAQHAKISPAYVFKLFPSKEGLFVAALERAFARIRSTLAEGADRSADAAPELVLAAMGAAYATLIAERDLLMLQVHALSVADIPEIGASFRAGLQLTVDFVHSRSGASHEAVQRFFAYGQLCHLIATLSLDGEQGGWTRTLTAGMHHP